MVGSYLEFSNLCSHPTKNKKSERIICLYFFNYHWHCVGSIPLKRSYDHVIVHIYFLLFLCLQFSMKGSFFLRKLFGRPKVLVKFNNNQHSAVLVSQTKKAYWLLVVLDVTFSTLRAPVTIIVIFPFPPFWRWKK